MPWRGPRAIVQDILASALTGAPDTMAAAGAELYRGAGHCHGSGRGEPHHRVCLVFGGVNKVSGHRNPQVTVDWAYKFECKKFRQGIQLSRTRCRVSQFATSRAPAMTLRSDVDSRRESRRPFKSAWPQAGFTSSAPWPSLSRWHKAEETIS